MPGKMYATGEDFSTVMFDRRRETDWERAATSLTRYVAATFRVWLAGWLPVVRARAETATYTQLQKPRAPENSALETRSNPVREQSTAWTGVTSGSEFLSKAPRLKSLPLAGWWVGDSAGIENPHYSRPDLAYPVQLRMKGDGALASMVISPLANLTVMRP